MFERCTESARRAIYFAHFFALVSDRPEITSVDLLCSLLYGSDWPNSDPIAPYAVVLGLVREYFGAKGRVAAEKYFYRNSLAAYRWKKRRANQPSLA